MGGAMARGGRAPWMRRRRDMWMERLQLVYPHAETVKALSAASRTAMSPPPPPLHRLPCQCAGPVGLAMVRQLLCTGLHVLTLEGRARLGS
ncbi:hypothetical protein E2562_039114 [Oryza meyeriana var. granulata]|uniref:Uncharacterized protein n=1 Tax=Oryza meyeriana var. granulata TaxID=110450 RepID=A0A6G1E9Q4_9ORYZ|nr:hypothetical protein E2562_039114 [Oryza meyeriana var. granulata]